MNKKALQIDQELETRLSALAEQSGLSVVELVEDILRAHIDNQDGLIKGFEEDDARWQRYVDTGECVPASDVRDKLRTLAVKAAKKAEV